MDIVPAGPVDGSSVEHQEVLPCDRGDLLALLGTLDPIPRARVAAMLAHPDTVGAVAAVRREAVWEATRGQSRADVAAELGVSVSTVAKVIMDYNWRHGQ